MDKKLIARELVKIAKDLVAYEQSDYTKEAVKAIRQLKRQQKGDAWIKSQGRGRPPKGEGWVQDGDNYAGLIVSTSSDGRKQTLMVVPVGVRGFDLSSKTLKFDFNMGDDPKNVARAFYKAFEKYFGI